METVAGVQVSINKKSRLATVGTGLVGNNQRDQGWKFKGNVMTATLEQIEEQVRARPAFAALAAVAAASSGTASSTAAAGAPAQPEALPEPPLELEQRPARAHATEVLVCRPRRKRKQPEWLVPPQALRACATGSRKRKRPAGDCACDKPACAADRAERDELRKQLAREAAAHAQLRP